MMKKLLRLASLGLLAIGLQAQGIHLFEVAEIQFASTKPRTAHDAYALKLEVILSGPDGRPRAVPAFWDGDNVWRARLVATAPGSWRWFTRSDSGDASLDGHTGAFEAEAWTKSELAANPNRRGFLRVAKDGRTLQYADGTPFFMVSDTWWSALTRTYAWSNDNCIAGASFQKCLSVRQAQGFNCLNVIASFPSDTVKGIWNKKTIGEKVAEDGTAAFRLEGQQVDWREIQPAYWQQADVKMRYLWEHGFAVFLETVRRHEKWPDAAEADRAAFVDYCRYVRARWGCYNLIFSWLHWDFDPAEFEHWRPLVERALRALGPMHYDQPMTAMSAGTTMDNYMKKVPLVIDIQNVSNLRRDYRMFDWLTAQFHHTPAMPSLNLEPYYPDFNNGENNRAVRGTLSAAQMAEYMAYGSVLSGALAGHAWGDACFGGVHSETAEPHFACMDRWNAAAMGAMRRFFLDPGHDYARLVPAPENLADGSNHFLVFAKYPDRSVGLGYIAVGNQHGGLEHLLPATAYRLEWWDTARGLFSAPISLRSDPRGFLVLPTSPDAGVSWAYRIKAAR
jgi:hypothetical protein